MWTASKYPAQAWVKCRLHRTVSSAEIGMPSHSKMCTRDGTYRAEKHLQLVQRESSDYREAYEARNEYRRLLANLSKEETRRADADSATIGLDAAPMIRQLESNTAESKLARQIVLGQYSDPMAIDHRARPSSERTHAAIADGVPIASATAIPGCFLDRAIRQSSRSLERAKVLFFPM